MSKNEEKENSSFQTDENRILIKRMQSGDKAAANELAAKNTGLVKAAARRFIGRGVEFEDLVQLGLIGLFKAAKNFDLSRENRFSTYAVVLIIGEIKRFLRDDGMVKISRTLKKNAVNVSKERALFISREGKEPTVSQLCEKTGLSKEELVEAIEAGATVISLHSKPNENSLSPEEILGEDNISALTENISLRQAVGKLEKSERELIYLRYYRDLSQVKTAEILGITQVKVSRTEKKIIEKLRKELLPN